MIYSLTAKRPEDIGPGEFGTGVVRFVGYLRRVFPDLVSVIPEALPTFTPDDVVIADNHLSLLVPAETPCIVVHHGSAEVHYDRDPTWRTPATRKIVQDQRWMLTIPNRTFVAPSRWVADQFARVAGEMGVPYETTVIVHWVPPIPQGTRGPRPVILGDWRDYNKGTDHWRPIAALMPECDYRLLSCRTDAERIHAYETADLYLCLSLSEGFSYSMCDADAAGLPIVSTPTGTYDESADKVIESRDDAAAIVEVIRGALRTGRLGSYHYPFKHWADAWQAQVKGAQMPRWIPS